MPPDPAAKPTIRELEILRSMIAAGRTHAAAQAVGLSQPAVSRSLAVLEGKVGRRLFARDGNRLIPTAEALALDAAAAGILEALDRLGQAGGPVASGLPVRIAISPTLAQYLLPRVVAAFRATHPDIRIEVEIGRGTDVLAQVADQRVDLGLVDNAPAHPAIAAQPLREARSHVILPADHRLAGASRLTPTLLAREDFVALARRFASRAEFDRAFHQARVAQRVVAEVSTIAFAVELVRAGVGLALLNPFPVSLGGLTGLRAVPFEPQVRYRTEILMPVAGTRNQSARRFIDHLRHLRLDCPVSHPPL